MKDLYKRVRFWCDFCDCAKNPPGVKCKVCGHTTKGKPYRKRRRIDDIHCIEETIDCIKK